MSPTLFQTNSYLWIALRFHKLPLESLVTNINENKTIVVTDMQRVIYANEAACAAGVRYAMDVTTAKLLSNCESFERNRSQETQVLQSLSEQLYQFTPYLETYQCQYAPHSGLLLEISSCLQLFSGAKALTEKIFMFINAIGYSFEYGFAHTAKAAWLLSFANNGKEISGKETNAFFCGQLKQLPIQLIHDFPAAVETLEKTGFKTLDDIIRQISTQKITSIKMRLGEKFTSYICELFAIEQNLQQRPLFTKPLPLYKPEEYFSERIQFDYPITQSNQLYHPIEHLLQNLSNYLRRRQQQSQHIEWTLGDIYNNKFIINMHSDTPESYWQLLYDLTLIQLDNRELPFEVDSLELNCRSTSPTQNKNQLLAFDSQKPQVAAHNFAVTMAKLKARLGDAAVFKLSYCDSLIPENSNLIIPISERPKQDLSEIHKKSARPTWLFPTPILIEERNQILYWRGQLTLIAGPERIRTHWWEKPIARDYFIAQRHDAVRLWVFLDLLQKTWYVHGIFA